MVRTIRTLPQRSAAVFFFFLWILTLIGFSYQQYYIHLHYKTKQVLRSAAAKLSQQYQLFEVSGQQIHAASLRLATESLTPLKVRLPFWKKDSAEMKTVSSTTIYETKHARFEKHVVQLETGTVIDDWAWFEEPDQVNVAVQMSGGSLLLFKQSKYGLDSESLAPVGGMIELGETPLQAAKRETHEELHVKCEVWTFTGRYRVATNRGGGFCNCFVAQKCERIPNENLENPFDYELQQIVEVSVDDLRGQLHRSEIKEIKWVATLSRALSKFDEEDGTENKEK